MSEIVKNTPLVEFHKRHGGRIVDFAGWNLPVQYEGIMKEHLAVRNGAGMFDASHMGEIIVSGKRALDFLNASLSNDFSTLQKGAARYAFFCNPDGTCADDVIVYNLGDLSYMIVLNASNAQKDVSLFQKLAEEFGGGVSISDISDDVALLAIQGVKSEEAVAKVFKEDFSSLKRFRFVKIGNTMISRTGYTGGDGFEIFLPSKNAEPLAEKFLSVGNVELCGLGARDSLRVEACLPLYGHEISDKITPLEAGLGWAVKLEKKFVGSEALSKQASDGLKRRVVWFKTQGRRIVRSGDAVFFADKKIGEVLSGVWSASCECPMGSALIEISDDVPDSSNLYANVRGTLINIELRNKSK